MTGLTRRQSELLAFIARYTSDNGQAPTLREMGAAIGSSSPSTVSQLLIGLRGRGRVVFRRGIARSVAIIAEATYTLPAHVQRKLELHCRVAGELPAAVVTDAVTLHLDKIDGYVAQ